MSVADAPRSVYIETYGCQMNVADSELVAGLLARHGYETVAAPEGADVILVNTCAVRDHAEQRVIGRVGELKRFKRPGGVLGVVGCMAQRLGERLLERAPHVDLVLGPDGYRLLPQLIARARDGDRVAETAFVATEHYDDIVPIRRSAVSGWVTVQRGCDYRCTFCIVPMTRGPERSRRLADLVREVRSLAGRGVTEVTLLGQTVNSYHDGEHDFADLLRAVGGVDGVRRLRFTSPHPRDFSDRVIEAMAEVPAVCEHVHLPAQSGSDRVLRRMLRRYTRDGYLEVVARLRAAIPDLALSTDLIVGFPGETEDDFAQTLSLVREVGFDDAFTFRFSPREGTPAVRLPGAVPEEVAGERLERLVGEVRFLSRAKNAALVGTVHEILIEQRARRRGTGGGGGGGGGGVAALQGRTRAHKVVVVEGPEVWIGSYRTARLVGTTGATFTGLVQAEPRAVAGAAGIARAG